MNIALFGFGTVGKETALYLLNKQHILSSRSTQKINLKAIFTRSTNKVTDANINKPLIKNNWQDIINDPSIDCIVELMGSIELPLQIITMALKNKKHVITANKALLAHHGKELLSLAAQNGVCICFEASCGGGIPIIRALTDGLIPNDISAVYGVLNGTCNFILTEMEHKKVSFDHALKDAQELGLAEADPSLDIEGKDSGHKIAIMSTLSFNTNIDMDKIPIVGITDVQNTDITFAKKLGLTMKLIAAAIKIDSDVLVWVHPALLEQEHPMSSIEGSFNAISVLGSEVGHTLYYGRGAGGTPTNAAIIADIVSIANGSAKAINNSICMTHDKNTQNLQSGMDKLNTETYIRLNVTDKPGVLASITAIFQNHNISIARVLQEDFTHASNTQNPPVSEVALIIICHASPWNKIQMACSEIENLTNINNKPIIYPIIHPPDDKK